MSAFISQDAYDGLERFAANQGVSMTALVEAFGLMAAAGLPSRVSDELVRIARAVTAERRSRR